MRWEVTEDTQCLSLACTFTHVCILIHACMPHTHEYTHILRKSNCKKKRLQLKSLQLFSCTHGSASLTVTLQFCSTC